MFVKVIIKRYDDYPFEVGDTIEVRDEMQYGSISEDHPKGYYIVTNPMLEVEGEDWLIDPDDFIIEKHKSYKLSKFKFI